MTPSEERKVRDVMRRLDPGIALLARMVVANEQFFYSDENSQHFFCPDESLAELRKLEDVVGQTEVRKYLEDERTCPPILVAPAAMTKAMTPIAERAAAMKARFRNGGGPVLRPDGHPLGERAAEMRYRFHPVVEYDHRDNTTDPEVPFGYVFRIGE